MTDSNEAAAWNGVLGGSGAPVDQSKCGPTAGVSAAIGAAAGSVATAIGIVVGSAFRQNK